MTRTTTGRARAVTLAIAIAIPLLVLAAPNAHADTDTNTCVGQQVVRCLDIHYDSTHRRVRAHSTILDNGNFPDDYVVDAVSVGGLEDSPGGGQDVVDTANGPLLSCAGPTGVYQVTAVFRWRKVGTSTLSSGALSLKAVVC